MLTIAHPIPILHTPTQRILTQKARLDKWHQFALLALHDDGAALLQGFTSDARAVLATLEHLEPVAPWQGEKIWVESRWKWTDGRGVGGGLYI